MSLNNYFIKPNKDSSISVKIEAIRRNARVASAKRTEINNLLSWNDVSSSVLIADDNLTKSVVKNSVIDYKIDREFEDIYEKICLLDCLALSEDVLYMKLNEIITPDNIRYHYLVEMIILRLYGEMIEYNKMLFGETESEEIECLKDILKGIKLKMEVFMRLLQEREIIETAKPGNKLCFLAQDSGTIIAKTSIMKNIPQSFYQLILNALLSIENGVFNGIKGLAPKPFFELRRGEIRVLVDKLSDGNYIIIDIFVKKVSSNSGYKAYLANRSNQYLRYKDYYKVNMNNPLFRETQEQAQLDIMTLLNGEEIKRGGRG